MAYKWYNNKMIIYKITNKINGKRYIGQTQNTISARWSQHVHNAVKKKGRSILSEAIRKYGRENFEIKSVCRCNDIEGMNRIEINCIRLFKTLAPNGYNLDSGGKNNIMHEKTKLKLRLAKLGKSCGPFTQEHKNNLSKAHKGRKYPNRIISGETRKKISEANKGSGHYMFGKKQTEEVKQKLSLIMKDKYIGENNPFYGKKHSEESKKKISESRTGKYGGDKNPMFGKKGELSPNFGRKCSEETKRKISKSRDKIKRKVFCVNNDTIYESIREASRALPVSPAGIRKVLQHKMVSIKGYYFEEVK
jgi:group I intron endonuclease